MLTLRHEHVVLTLVRTLDLTPADLGMPEKFEEFRTQQEDFIARVNDWEGRVIAGQIPTGGGKSLAYMSAAVFAGKRAAILTASKGLQTQLLGDFGEMGLVDARGRQNFQCLSRAGKSCEWGAATRCPHRSAPACPYTAQLETARKSELVETNYSYWTSVHQHAKGLGDFDLLILDEAHAAPDQICSAASVTIRGREIITMLRTRPPARDNDPRAWMEFGGQWYDLAHQTVLDVQKSLKAGAASDWAVTEFMEWSKLESSLLRLMTAKGEWVVVRGRDSWTITPVWPKDHAEDLLFFHIPKLILVSATLHPKTLSIMGLPTGRANGTLYLEYPSTFRAANSPFYYIPTVKLQSAMSDLDREIWMERIDEIIDSRLDRKGLIHAVSYERAKYILENSRHKAHMIDYGRGEVADVVEMFKGLEPPAILIGPSTTTGFDFPGDLCRYQIHCKVPFSDPRDPLAKARAKHDKHYGIYSTALEIVQSDGRGTRSVTDWCENFMIDDQWAWFRGAARKFLPSHFLRRVITSDTVPPPFDLDGTPANRFKTAKKGLGKPPSKPFSSRRPEPVIDRSAEYNQSVPEGEEVPW